MDVKRRLSQLCAALLYNSAPLGGRAYLPQELCVPGLNCAYCPAAVAGCPLGAWQNLCSGGLGRVPFYLAASILLAALCLGRLICGWLCPFGFLQELLYKLPGPKLAKGRWSRRLSALKYLLLLGVTAVPLYLFYSGGAPLPVFCEYLCPNGFLSGLLMLLTGEGFAYAFLGWGKGLLALAVLLLVICCYRSFCRFFCPLGAFYSFFHSFALVGIKVDPARCLRCGACTRRCLLDCRQVGDRECIACGACRQHCPTQAISYGWLGRRRQEEKAQP